MLSVLAGTVTSIKVLSGIPWPNLLASVLAITSVMTVIGGLLIVLSKIKTTIKRSIQTLSLLVVLAYTMIMVSYSLMMLSDMSWDNVLLSVSAILIVTTGMVELAYLLSKIKTTIQQTIRTLSLLVVLAYGLLMFGASLKLVQSMGLTMESVFSLGVIGVAILEMMGLVSLLKDMKIIDNKMKKTLKLMVTFASSLLILAASLKLIENMRLTVNSLLNLGILGIAMLEMSVLTFLLSKIKFTSSNLTKTLKLMITFATGLLILAASLKLIQSLSLTTDTLFNLGVLGALMLEMVGLTFLLSKINPTAKKTSTTLKIMTSLIAALLIVTLSLKQLSSMPLGNILSSATAISVVMSVLVGLTFILSKVKTTVKKSLQALV